MHTYTNNIASRYTYNETETVSRDLSLCLYYHFQLFKQYFLPQKLLATTDKTTTFEVNRMFRFTQDFCLPKFRFLYPLLNIFTRGCSVCTTQQSYQSIYKHRNSFFQKFTPPANICLRRKFQQLLVRFRSLPMVYKSKPLIVNGLIQVWSRRHFLPSCDPLFSIKLFFGGGRMRGGE